MFAGVIRAITAPGSALLRWGGLSTSVGGYLSLTPVAVGVYEKLNVAALTALVGTRIYDDVPQAPTFPCVFYEVLEARDVRGFGTGGMPEVELLVHVFSTYEGSTEAQTVMKKVIELLRDQAITVDGYNLAGGVFYDQTLIFADQIIQGVKVRELVSRFRVYVEEA